MGVDSGTRVENSPVYPFPLPRVADHTRRRKSATSSGQPLWINDKPCKLTLERAWAVQLDDRLPHPCLGNVVVEDQGRPRHGLGQRSGWSGMEKRR